MAGDVKKNIILEFEAKYKGIKEAAQELQRTTNEIKLAADAWNLSTSAVNGAKKAIIDKKEAMNDHANRLRVSNNLMKQSGLEEVALARGLKNMGLEMDKAGRITTIFGKKIRVADLNMKQLRKSAWRFNMNMLTLLFGFMALQRIISQFGRSAISTYQKANEDTEGLGKATWHLQAAWEFLKYSLVDALTQSPLFKMLVQWLLQLVQWFNKLDPAVKQFIAIGLAILFIIVTVGFLHAQLAPLFSFLSKVIPWIAGLLTGTLGVAFWIVAAIVAAVVILWMTDLGNFRDFFKETFGILWEVVKMVFKHIWKTIKDVLALIKAIFRGDFDEVYKIIEGMWKRSLAYTLKIVHALMAVIDNFGRWMGNTLIDAAQFAANSAIAVINALIGVMNRLPGVSIPIIPNADFSHLKQAYRTMDDIKKDFEIIDKTIGVVEEVKSPKVVEADKKSTKGGDDNRIFNIDMDFNIEGGENLDEDKLYNQMMDKLGEGISRVTDVNNT